MLRRFAGRTNAFIVLSCLLAVALAVAFATLAYLTSMDELTNVFTSGNVSITMDESKVDEQGEKVGSQRVTQNTFKLYPGWHYTKDPVIYVDADSQPCYLFLKVDNALDTYEVKGDNYATDDMKQKTIHQQLLKNKWELKDNANKIYALQTTTNGGVNVPTFLYFNTSQYSEDENGAFGTIMVTAYALQASGFENYNAAYTVASEIWRDEWFGN